MKKLLTIVVAAALVCAVAGQASATALETSGELRVRGWYLDNYLLNKKSTEFWDQRLRLKMVWPVAEGVKVTARADILEGFWGGDANVANHTANQDPITGKITVTETLAQPWEARQQIIFDWVNMEFTWPGAPLTFTLGRQDVTWGTGYAAAADNRDRFKVSLKLDPVTLVAMYDKYKEVFIGHLSNYDDNRGYGAAVVATIGPFKAGLLEYYSINETDPAVDRTALLSDLYAMGKAGPVDIKAEAAFVVGKDDFKVGEDTDTRGIGAYVGAFVPAGPVTIGVEGAYASGDKPGTKDKLENAFKADYQGPYWSVIFYQNMDYPGYALDTQTSDLGNDFGVKNAISGKLTAIFSPIKNLTLIGAALYAACDQKVAGADKAMGTELDFIVSYGVTDNVNITAGVGYAILGNYWKGKVGADPGDKPDNPLGSVVAFSVKF